MPSPTRRKEERGLYLYYLYGFCRADEPFSLQETGIDGEDPVFLLSDRDLGALVSRVPLADYSEKALHENLENLAWLTPRVKRHEQIMKTVMAFGPVMPVRFCTIYKSRERILGVLRNHYEEFQAGLRFVQNKEEWGVKIYVEEEAGEVLVGKTSPALRALEKRLLSASTGESYFLKKSRDKLLKEERERSLETLTAAIYAKICSWSTAGQRNRPLDRRATGKNAEMIFNAAFLVDKEKVSRFIERLDQLAADYESQGLFFEMSGPWPPYNFRPPGP